MTSKQSLLFGAKLVFSALLLWLVLSRLDIADVSSRLRATDLVWLPPVLLLGPVSVSLTAWRWHTLSLGFLTFWEAVRYTWIGIFFGSIVPGAIGGDVAKGVSFAAKRVRAVDHRLPLSIVVDKLVGLWVLLLQFIVVAFFALSTQSSRFPEVRTVLWVSTAATLAGLASAVALCLPSVSAKLRTLSSHFPGPLKRGATICLDALGSYAGKGASLVKAAGISVLIHLSNALSLWLVMQALAISASPWFAVLFYSMLSVVLALPVSISGVGLRDAFAASLFTAYGLEAESGVALSWLLLALSLPYVLAGGVVQLWEMFRRRATD
jgi:uncharacterized membrane protein YbhN (UPF0104 family)